jgi:DNA-binding HxlR family transcriptional regulator
MAMLPAQSCQQSTSTPCRRGPAKIITTTRVVWWLHQKTTLVAFGSMLKSEYEGQNCSIARALEAVGERWTLLIVRELLRRPHRFAELEDKLAIAKNVLAARLTKLVDLGVVEKVPYTDARDWNDYRLTRKGKDLFPVISALMAWGDRYEAPNGPPVIFEHECGHPVGHKMVCAHCGTGVSLRTLRVVAGPGATNETILA